MCFKISSFKILHIRNLYLQSLKIKLRKELGRFHNIRIQSLL